MPWANKRTALLDRNVLVRLEKLQRNSGASRSETLVQWLGLDSEVVSPILFALEGAGQKSPSAVDIRQELTRATEALHKALPGAKIVKLGDAGADALGKMVVERATFLAKATRLFLKAVPFVVNRVAPSKQLKLETEVAAIAAAEGIRRGSLAFLALISCVYDRNPPSAHRVATPGRFMAIRGHAAAGWLRCAPSAGHRAPNTPP